MDKDDNNRFVTPIIKRDKRFKDAGNFGTPILIPPSPCMKKLGYGTGINVYRIERFSPLRGLYRSPWAVKKINSKFKGEDTEIKIRLEEETEILKSLSHPNIIGFRSKGKTVDGKSCLVMESSERSLSDAIEERSNQNLGPFSSNDILRVAKCLASALDYLHRKCHILHGDLKSANVLIMGEFDSIKLCDFGVTVKLNDKLIVDDKKNYIGTECWSAPEVLIGDELSHKTDMFSYGLVLWEMIALCPPHLDKLEENSALFDDFEVNDSVLEDIEEKRMMEYEQALGTRPALPSDQLDESYNTVLEIFYLTTTENQQDRASAELILSTFF